jgi:hypothetical protein
MVAPDEFERRVRADAPVGSWALYVDKYAFIDGVDRCEFRFDVVPGDGLSAAGTRSTFSTRSIEVKCDLADHRAGPRSWTFAFRTAGDIVPGKSRVKIFLTSARSASSSTSSTRGSGPRRGRSTRPSPRKTTSSSSCRRRARSDRKAARRGAAVTIDPRVLLA